MKGHSWYISCSSCSLPPSDSFCEHESDTPLRCAIRKTEWDFNHYHPSHPTMLHPGCGDNEPQTMRQENCRCGCQGTLKAPPMPSHTGRCSRVCVQAKIQGMARRSSMLPAAWKHTDRDVRIRVVMHRS